MWEKSATIDDRLDVNAEVDRKVAAIEADLVRLRAEREEIKRKLIAYMNKIKNGLGVRPDQTIVDVRKTTGRNPEYLCDKP